MSKFVKGDIWNGWTIDEFIGEGSFGEVYKIVRNEFGHEYDSALKVIHIPQSQSEVKMAFSDGMSEESVNNYFQSMVEDIVSEFILMSQLKGNSNIVSYEDHNVVPSNEGFGWDIYIRMELLTPLSDRLSNVDLTRLEIIKLGIDICKALIVCKNFNIIHRDIKPENIFYSRQDNYKLGDFGIAKQLEGSNAGMSKKGTFLYMAPEVYKGEKYDTTVDLYSLGIVLYRLLNNNRTPFLPPYPESIKFSDKEKATYSRMSGEPLPLPCNAQDSLGEVILKACAFDVKDRYKNPEEFLEALEKENNYESKRETNKTILPHEPFKIADNKMSFVGNNAFPFNTPTEVQSNETYTKYNETVLLDPEISTGEVNEEKGKVVKQEKKDEVRLGSKLSEESTESESKHKKTDNNSTTEITNEKNKRWIPIVCAIIGLAAIACFVLFGGKATVPDVTGLSIEEATARLENVGLTASIAKEKFSKDVPRNSVISQEIKEGEKVKKGTEIQIVVSKGVKCVVPEFKGHSLEYIEKHNKTFVKKIKISKKYTYSDDVKKGIIISQDKDTGEVLEEGSKISITISKGIEQVKVPDVTGKSKETAEKKIKDAKLKSTSSEEYSDSVSKGKVISQSIKGGKKVDKGSTVALVISKGPKPVQTYTPSNTWSSGGPSSGSNNSSNRSGGNSNRSGSSGGNSGGFNNISGSGSGNSDGFNDISSGK